MASPAFFFVPRSASAGVRLVAGIDRSNVRLLGTLLRMGDVGLAAGTAVPSAISARPLPYQARSDARMADAQCRIEVGERRGILEKLCLRRDDAAAVDQRRRRFGSVPEVPGRRPVRAAVQFDATIGAGAAAQIEEGVGGSSAVALEFRIGQGLAIAALIDQELAAVGMQCGVVRLQHLHSRKIRQRRFGMAVARLHRRPSQQGGDVIGVQPQGGLEIGMRARRVAGARNIGQARAEAWARARALAHADAFVGRSRSVAGRHQ